MEEIKKKNKKLKKVAIILFIVIILLGVVAVFLCNNIKNTDDSDISIEPSVSDFAQIFNSKFNMYIGKQRGTAVKALLSSVMQSNNSNVHIVTIVVKDGHLENNESITNLMSKIEPKNIYEISIYDSDDDYYIDKIFIKTEGEDATEEEMKLKQK
ncbi:MAG: hypothetical protein E7310_04140 [Clostridiales bacterium]|nr:hypothetical protein [Clostridiales bacterium]